jgi:SAM-dependent methyltransferase
MLSSLAPVIGLPDAVPGNRPTRSSCPGGGRGTIRLDAFRAANPLRNPDTRSAEDLMTVTRTVHYESLPYENRGLPELVDLLRPSERVVLDVGCGTGANLEDLRQRGYHGTGLTLSQTEARIVRERGFPCLRCDLEREDPPLKDGTFDALILSHVLEHFGWPEEVLARLLRLVKPGGAVVVAVPNALVLYNRLRLLRGRFRYEDSGVMDRSHLRFFDFESIRLLLERAGLRVSAHLGVGQVPLGSVRRISRRLATLIDSVGSRLAPSVFAIHLLARGEVPVLEAVRRAGGGTDDSPVLSPEATAIADPCHQH